MTLSQGFSGHFLHYVTGIRTRLKWCSNLIFDKRGYTMLLNIFCGYQVLLLIFSAAPQCHLCSYRYCARPSLLTLLPRLRGPESLLLKRCRFMRKQRRGPVCFDERDLWERLAHMLLVTPSLSFSLLLSIATTPHTPPTTTPPQSFACSLFSLL